LMIAVSMVMSLLYVIQNGRIRTTLPRVRIRRLRCPRTGA
jgi:hypothetical protein